MVVRDDAGNVLCTEWKHLSACGSAEEAEVLACLEGLRYLAANPQRPGILDTDCSRIVTVLEAMDMDRSAHWSLFLEARTRLDMLPQVKLSRVGRECNRVAHDLAQLGKRECGVLFGAVPSDVYALLFL
jgi:hypothetical protein